MDFQRRTKAEKEYPTEATSNDSTTKQKQNIDIKKKTKDCHVTSKSILASSRGKQKGYDGR